jgi:hypothetical protein
LDSFQGEWLRPFVAAARAHSLQLIKPVLAENQSPAFVNEIESASTALCVAAGAGDLERFILSFYSCE